MSHDQRLHNLGIPTNLPEDEEKRRVDAKLREVVARLAEAEYRRRHNAEWDRMADVAEALLKRGKARKGRG